MQSFFYWQTQDNGPKLGALILSNYDYLPFDLTNNSKEEALARLGEAIGIVWFVPHYKKYVAQNDWMTIFTQPDSLDIPEAISKFKPLFEERQAFIQRYQTDPEFALLHELQTFDWYYQYSDDARTYKNSIAQSDRIDNLVKKLGARGEELFMNHCPYKIK